MLRSLRPGTTCGLLVVACLLAARAGAQDTRAGTIAAKQAAKAQALSAYQPNAAERILGRIGAQPRGLYPYFGSVYPGGSFTLGAGYRKWVGYQSFFDLHGLYSITNYKQIELTWFSPQHARGRLDFAVNAGWRDGTRIPFFGLGPGSDADDRTSFRLQEGYFVGGATYRPRPWLHLDGAAGYRDYNELAGKGSDPSIEQRFDKTTAPRLGEDPAYVYARASAGVSWLDAPAYSRHGGLYRMTYESYDPSRSGDGRFGIARLEAVQHVPLLRETWVLSFRARTESIVGGDEDDAPYFLLPYLGSGRTLRSFSSTRFRDRHSLLLNGEWRWIPNRAGLDMALFVDAGKVAPRWNGLSLEDLAVSYGIGGRFHTTTATVLRIEVAHGREGWNSIVAFTAPF